MFAEEILGFLVFFFFKFVNKKESTFFPALPPSPGCICQLWHSCFFTPSSMFVLKGPVTKENNNLLSVTVYEYGGSVGVCMVV